jgi:hypothetical protein
LKRVHEIDAEKCKMSMTNLDGQVSAMGGFPEKQNYGILEGN